MTHRSCEERWRCWPRWWRWWIVVLVLSRCSTPSTINTAAAAGAGSDSLNAAAAGLAAVAGLGRRAGRRGAGAVAGPRHRGDDRAPQRRRARRGHLGAHRTRLGGARSSVAHSGAAGPEVGGPAQRQPRRGARRSPLAGDARLPGCLARRRIHRTLDRGGLRGAAVERGTYDSWTFTGLGTPQAVPGTSIEVIPVDFEATSAETTRTYRVFVAVVADPTSRLTVNAVGHRSPH